ncbi:MAG: hypothetical protein V5A20_01660 [Salinibacter sp.]|uniref:hypothetical protein n=1 Tax=Salinibacter sp. TaxID=2065818 RepID=UPI002FC38EFA
MKRLLVIVALFLCTSLASCQCSEQPDVGPVEGEEEQAHRMQDTSSVEATRLA